MRNTAVLLLLASSLSLGLSFSCSGSNDTPGGGGGGGGSGGSGDSGGSGGTGGTSDFDGTGGADGFEPPHARFPQVIYQGGPILTAPQIVTVTFPGDPMTSELQSFGETVEASSWWSTVTHGYCQGPEGACIGQGSAPQNVVFGTAPASSYSDSQTGGSSTLQQWISDGLSSGALPSPESGSVSNTLYVLYFPATTTIELNDLKSCVDFDGYHSAFTVGSQVVPYAVVPECSGPMAGNTPPITTLQNTTITASHEILEATTDPVEPSQGGLAWYLSLIDVENRGWTDIQGGGELADLCIDPFLLDQDETAEGSFTVQRIWSNTHAAQGLDPCNPIPTTEVYFNAAPNQSYFVLDVGSSITFDVNAFSTGKRSDWTLTVQDWSDLASTSSPTYLDFTVAGAVDHGMGPEIQVNNGTTVSVTMTLKMDPGSLPTNEADGSIITFSGSSSSPTAAHFWPFVVLSPADALDAGLDATLTTGSAEEPRRPLRRIKRHLRGVPGFGRR
jgi:hypothetical protein